MKHGSVRRGSPDPAATPDRRSRLQRAVSENGSWEEISCLAFSSFPLECPRVFLQTPAVPLRRASDSAIFAARPSKSFVTLEATWPCSTPLNSPALS